MLESFRSRQYKMFQLWMSLFVAVLFFVLTPGVLLRLPPGAGKFTVAGVHAVVFALVFGLTQKAVLHFLYPEGFMSGAAAGSTPIPMGEMCPNGMPKSAMNLC